MRVVCISTFLSSSPYLCISTFSYVLPLTYLTLFVVSTRSCSECQGLRPPLYCQGVGLIYGPLRDCLGDDAPDGTALPPPVLWHIQVNMGSISYTNIWRGDTFHHCIAVFSNLCSKARGWKAGQFSCVNKILLTSFQGNCNIHGTWLRGAAMFS